MLGFSSGVAAFESRLCGTPCSICVCALYATTSNIYNTRRSGHPAPAPAPVPAQPAAAAVAAAYRQATRTVSERRKPAALRTYVHPACGSVFACVCVCGDVKSGGGVGRCPANNDLFTRQSTIGLFLIFPEFSQPFRINGWDMLFNLTLTGCFCALRRTCCALGFGH